MARIAATEYWFSLWSYYVFTAGSGALIGYGFYTYFLVYLFFSLLLMKKEVLKIVGRKRWFLVKSLATFIGGVIGAAGASYGNNNLFLLGFILILLPIIFARGFQHRTWRDISDSSGG